MRTDRIVVASHTIEAMSTDLNDGELDLVVDLAVALGRHQLAEVEEHARLAVDAADEAEAVLQAAH